MRGSHPHEKKLGAFDSASPFSTLSLSAEGRVIQETLLIMTLKRFPSVVLVMLCPHLTRRPDDNTAVAPCNLAVNDHEIRRILTCGYPQCSLGPSTPERSTHCLVPCYPQYEFPLGIREVSLLPFLGAPMVCAVPFSEVVPFCVELADVYSSLVSSLSFAVLGTELDIFCRRVDPPRGIEVEGRIPAQGANRPGVTESKKGIPARGLNPLSPTMLESRMIAEDCPTSVTKRASPSIGRVDADVQISLCECDLVRRIPVGVRRINQSWTAGTKGVVPFRRRIQPCAAGATGSKEVTPVGRVNRSCTTPSNTECEGECEESSILGLPSRFESRCPKRDAVGRTRVSSDFSGIGTRRGRSRCSGRGVSPPSSGLWAWSDRHDGNRVTNFIPPCCDWSPIIVVAVEQSDLVSPLLYHPSHLFFLLPDLAVTNLLRWKDIALLHRSTLGWEKQALRTPRGSDNVPISPGTVVKATTLLQFASSGAPPLSAPLTSSPTGDMDVRASFFALLLGLTLTASASHFHRSATLGSLVGLVPTVSTNRFTLQNGYGTVEARFHLTAYDCSDPSEVQAYSSIPASHCSTRATPVKKDRPTRFQLLQKERKRYINAYVCSLFRTDIRYNCGVYGHPELDPMHWSFLIPQRVTVEQCLEWLRTRTYRPAYHSTMMHGKEFTQPVLVDEPNYITYLVYGRTFLQAPALPTDLVTDIACQGEWYEYQPDKPQNHIVAFYDELHLQTVTLVVEEEKVIDKGRQLSLPCPWNDGHCHAEGLTYLWNVTGPEYCPVAVVKEFLGHRLHANVSQSGDSYDSHHAEAIVSAEAEEKIRIQPTGPVSQCGRVVTSTNIEDMFLFPILETDDKGRVLTDNRDQIFERRIHPGEVDLRKYIANRDEYLYYDITSQAEREFDAILHHDCLRRQDEARKAHFFEHGLPGYQPFLLQDGAFSTRSGETNYRYQCLPRTVHPVSASRCYNKLPVVLRLPQHLAAGVTLNFSASHTYFLDPDSRLLSPIASEVPCSALFPAIYQTHQGWIAVTPDIHQAPAPRPLPVQPPHRTEDVFREPDYNEGGLYQSDTLDAMQDFLLTPLLREAVTYKLAHQVHNLRPEREYVLGPLDVFPVDAAAAADWRNLLFGGWWSWLEKWGKVASICIGAYYLYVAARWIVTTLFSLKVLYEEHGFGPNLLWGLGPGQDVFPMRFYRRWRRFKQHLSSNGKGETPRVPPRPLPHEYLMMEEVRAPTLPRRNLGRPGVYPELPHTTTEADAVKRPSSDQYAKPGCLTERAPCLSESDSEVSPPQTPRPNPVVPEVRLERMIPPGAAPAAESEGLVGLPNPRRDGAFRPVENTFPQGPIGAILQPRP